MSFFKKIPYTAQITHGTIFSTAQILEIRNILSRIKKGFLGRKKKSKSKLLSDLCLH